MSENRVVVTGLGVVTPIGNGIDNFTDGLMAGRNGIAGVTGFDVSDYRSKLAAEVKDFQADDWMEAKSARRMDRFTQFALAASSMAMKDAGLDSFPFDSNRTGVIIGSGIGGSQAIEEGHSKLLEDGPSRMNPLYVSRMLINMAACMASIKFGLKGPISAPSVACSTGSNAIGDAFRILQRGDAEIMFAGSSEACITPLPWGCFCATRSMTSNDCVHTACRPFDRNRDGFVMGEGAGIAILENLKHATDRGARIYAEIAGYGSTADAYHITAPEPQSDGMIRVMQTALRDADMDKEKIGYINAHGTSTILNDKCESAAIEKVFGEHSKTLKVSSIKSMIGHLLAGAGSVEFVSAVISIFSGMIPPTINYTEPDPDCSLDYVTKGAESHDLFAAMSNSFGFGGGNACLIIKKYGDINGNS